MSIKKMIPRGVKKILKPVLLKRNLLKNIFYDYKFYLNNSATIDNKKNEAAHKAELIFYYHKIEKGLALPNPRVGFGKDAIEYLMESLTIYISKYGMDREVDIALNTLELYYKFNLEKGLDIKNVGDFLSEIKSRKDYTSNTGEGGVLKVKKEEILQSSSIDFIQFVNNRYSIRNFTGEKVLDSTIIEAIKMAQKSPSVCNRQSARVHIFSQKESKEQALSYQNDNAGFGDKASHIILITSEVDSFWGASERHQAYIDGGMFAMSLIYGFHALGLGTCALNLALDYRADLKLKEKMNINENEAVIMMIAVGHIPKELLVAASPRKPLEEILTKH